ncbi:AEC family transporter [Ideonella livida]|uniref:AEC family transporter n=1 Tax=Ideonella livida TaxID=2707176 RepID=A0A7C9PH16_9BURK|nr:AEC family transporter [Ideonella livida]NDY90834.1 AEC family transporter [Ideonella livida]
MSQVLLLLPDFLLIVAGAWICRRTALNRPIWEGVERLVYYLLFPCLLFVAIVRQPLQLGTALNFLGCGLAVIGAGIAMAYLLRRWPGVDALTHASGAQTAFRFNSYVGLALAERLGGVQGVAAIAVLIAVCVPVCNVAAVWPLARQGGQHLGRELARNPLILGTLSGLAVNLLGVPMPDLLTTTLARVGGAALPLGLMAVGAGLQMGALRDAPGLASGFLAIRHLLLPALAIALVTAAGLPPLQQMVIVAFSALPTASSAYVLAARMGGHGAFVAGLVSLSTLLGMLSVPLALGGLALAQASGMG